MWQAEAPAFVLVGRGGGRAWTIFLPHLWSTCLAYRGGPCWVPWSQGLRGLGLPSIVHVLGLEALGGLFLPSSPLPFLCSCPDRQPEGAAGAAPFKAQAAPRCLPCQSPHFPGPGARGLGAQHSQAGLLQGEPPAHNQCLRADYKRPLFSCWTN